MVDIGGVPAVMSSSGEGGWGGGSAIWAIVLIALLGFNRGRGDDCGGGREAIDNAELNARFNSLEGQIQNVNDLAAIRDTFKESCETNMNVSNTGAALTRDILESKYDTSLQLKDMQAANAACCCETNRSIDQAVFENAKGQWEISKQISDCCCSTNLNMERGFNSILNRMDQEKIETLKDQLAAERLKSSQCAQNEYLVSRLGPQTPVPAYVTYPNCTPVFPPQIAASSNAVYGAFGLNNGYGGCAC